MEKIPIIAVVECPLQFYRKIDIRECYNCDNFKGMEYIDDGFKYVVCSYGSLIDEEGEKQK